ncbi:hypothetical protein C8J57DRAFT_1737037 [Mycena rebaudengoi]|nr:hypothetical protein C8J57DRAFT_1737037 [Mycena rebaudengoi]
MEASMALSYQETRRTAVRLRVERGRQTCSGQDFSPYDFPNQSNKPIEVIQLDISIATLLKDAITDADLLVLIRDERIQSAGLATFAPKIYHYLVDTLRPLYKQDPTLEKKLRQFHLSCGNCNRALHDAYDGVPAITLKFLGLHMLRRWALKAMHHQMASPKKARSSFDPAGKRMKQEIMGRTRRHIALSPTQTKWLGQFTPPPQTPRHPDGSYAKRIIAQVEGEEGRRRAFGRSAKCAKEARSAAPYYFWGGVGSGKPRSAGGKAARAARGGGARGGSAGAKANSR